MYQKNMFRPSLQLVFFSIKYSTHSMSNYYTKIFVLRFSCWPKESNESMKIWTWLLPALVWCKHRKIIEHSRIPLIFLHNTLIRFVAMYNYLSSYSRYYLLSFRERWKLLILRSNPIFRFYDNRIICYCSEF